MKRPRYLYLLLLFSLCLFSCEESDDCEDTELPVEEDPSDVSADSPLPPSFSFSYYYQNLSKEPIPFSPVGFKVEEYDVIFQKVAEEQSVFFRAKPNVEIYGQRATVVDINVGYPASVLEEKDIYLKVNSNALYPSTDFIRITREWVNQEDCDEYEGYAWYYNDSLASISKESYSFFSVTK